MSTLCNDDISLILSKFPKDFHVSYENIINNPSNNIFNFDLVLAIPDGKKCFVYFTSFENRDVCFLFLLGEDNRKILDVSVIQQISFTHSLVYGTILYGTYFGVGIGNGNGDKKCIAIEDILYYKGKNVSFRLFHEKLKLFSLLFDSDIDISSDFHKDNTNFVLIRLCIMNTTIEKLLQYTETENFPYKIKLINYRFLSNSKKSLHAHYHQVVASKRMKPDAQQYKNNTLYIRPPPPSTPFPSGLTNNRPLPFPQQYPQPPVLTIPQYHNNPQPPQQQKQTNRSTFQSPQPSQHKQQNQSSIGKDVVFIVRATPKDDIYNLFAFDTVKNEEVFYDVAYIPNCKTSVFMNSLFRNIKENANLDLLEESDDEEDFENTDPDKYVFLDRTFKMVCNFQQKFRKWIPINVVKDTEIGVVVSYQFLQQQYHQKNNNHQNYQRR